MGEGSVSVDNTLSKFAVLFSTPSTIAKSPHSERRVLPHFQDYNLFVDMFGKVFDTIVAFANDLLNKYSIIYHLYLT